MLLHIISEEELVEARTIGEIVPPSLESEGFVHCSYPDQILTPANERFHGQGNLVLLLLDPTNIEAKLVVEDSYGSGMPFPHIYGSIPVGAIEHVIPFPCEPDGSFKLPRPVRDLVAGSSTATP